LPARIARHWKLWTALLVAVAAGAVLALYAAAGFFDSDPFHLFGMGGPRKPVAALFFSGDMGLRFGMGPYVATALADAGVPVLGVSSSTAFARHRSREEVDAIVADAIRDTLTRTGAEKIVVLGQSFGADMLQVGLPSLPADLRAKVAMVALVVPGDTVDYSASPSELFSWQAPDARALPTARQLDWVPVLCIHGVYETDSLCPLMTMNNVTRVGLPGGHPLRRDADRLYATIADAMARTLPKVQAAQSAAP